MRGIIDRFESEYAVVELEDRRMINIKRDIIPKECKEGYAINIEDDIITIDWVEIERLKQEIEELEKDLWQ